MRIPYSFYLIYILLILILIIRRTGIINFKGVFRLIIKIFWRNIKIKIKVLETKMKWIVSYETENAIFSIQNGNARDLYYYYYKTPTENDIQWFRNTNELCLVRLIYVQYFSKTKWAFSIIPSRHRKKTRQNNF